MEDRTEFTGFGADEVEYKACLCVSAQILFWVLDPCPADFLEGFHIWAALTWSFAFIYSMKTIVLLRLLLTDHF